MMQEKPFDFLNKLKGKKIRIEKTNKEIVEGVLKAFDLNINMSVQVDGHNTFIPGYSISLVYYGVS